jgi:hypothetical protein
MINTVLTLCWAFLKDSAFHKRAASAAAGTSIGMMTVLGILRGEIKEVKADLKKEIEINREYSGSIEVTLAQRKEIVDERFDIINENLKYLRGAIDATNQNILNLSRDSKKTR